MKKLSFSIFIASLFLNGCFGSSADNIVPSGGGGGSTTKIVNLVKAAGAPTAYSNEAAGTVNSNITLSSDATKVTIKSKRLDLNGNKPTIDGSADALEGLKSTTQDVTFSFTDGGNQDVGRYYVNISRKTSVNASTVNPGPSNPFSNFVGQVEYRDFLALGGQKAKLQYSDFGYWASDILMYPSDNSGNLASGAQAQNVIFFNSDNIIANAQGTGNKVFKGNILGATTYASSSGAMGLFNGSAELTLNFTNSELFAKFETYSTGPQTPFLNFYIGTKTKTAGSGVAVNMAGGTYSTTDKSKLLIENPSGGAVPNAISLDFGGVLLGDKGTTTVAETAGHFNTVLSDGTSIISSFGAK